MVGAEHTHKRPHSMQGLGKRFILLAISKMMLAALALVALVQPSCAQSPSRRDEYATWLRSEFAERQPW